jgi:hypothetical protein
LKASIVRRVEGLEERLKPCEAELPPVDFGLLIESEYEYFSRQMTVLRTKARELGYGDKNNKVSWFDLRGCDPVFDDEIREECLRALNADEQRVMETFYDVVEKVIRLTAVLSEEEKADVKKYNGVVLGLGNSLIRRCDPDAYTVEKLNQARLRYEEIMAKYGEAIYE